MHHAGAIHTHYSMTNVYRSVAKNRARKRKLPAFIVLKMEYMCSFVSHLNSLSRNRWPWEKRSKKKHTNTHTRHETGLRSSICTLAWRETHTHTCVRCTQVHEYGTARRMWSLYENMAGNSFKGMLIFQMLSDINKPPIWSTEIQFQRSFPLRYIDVYPSPRLSL